MVAQKDKQLSFITAAPPIHRTGQEKPVTRLRHRGDETFVFPVNLSGFYIIVLKKKKKNSHENSLYTHDLKKNYQRNPEQAFQTHLRISVTFTVMLTSTASRCAHVENSWR